MALKSSNVIARVEPEVKEKAEAIMASIGISASTGINMFYRQVILWNGLPFRPAIPVRRPRALEEMTKDEYQRYLRIVLRFFQSYLDYQFYRRPKKCKMRKVLRRYKGENL